jgi:hypothetical protein
MDIIFLGRIEMCSGVLSQLFFCCAVPGLSVRGCGGETSILTYDLLNNLIAKGGQPHA